MCSFILKEEFIFYIKKKKNYSFQTIINYLERTIFLVGMILLLCNEGRTLSFSYLLKAIFWFVIVNGILEITQRIENEIRLKQFDKCFNVNTSYWILLFLRFIPLLIDSLIIGIISSIIVCLFVEVLLDITIINACIYIIMMLFQYIITLYIFSFIGIYFQRIQAVIGIIESYAFFYSGIVIASKKYSIPIFNMITDITSSHYQSLPLLLLLMVIELMFIILGNMFITKYLKTKSAI